MISNEKEPPHTLRACENHPTVQKINKLCEVAQELGVYVQFFGHRTFVTDKEFPGRLYDISDIGNSDEAISDFPPQLDYKLTFENPKWTNWNNENNARREKERRQAEAEERRVREEEERQKARALEERERQELARLKEKYRDE